MRSQGEVGGPASVSSCGCPSPRKITFEIGMLTFGGLEGKDHNSNRKAGILLLDGSLSLGSASCTVSALPSGESRIMECHTIEWTLQKILNGKLLAARPPLIHRSISGPAYVPIPLMWLILGRLTPKCLLCVPYIPGCAKSLQLCLTLYDPMNCSLPDSSIHGILQARILEWVALSPPGDLPHPGIKPASLTTALAGGFFTTSATWEATPHHPDTLPLGTQPRNVTAVL